MPNDAGIVWTLASAMRDRQRLLLERAEIINIIKDRSLPHTTVRARILNMLQDPMGDENV